LGSLDKQGTGTNQILISGLLGGTRTIQSQPTAQVPIQSTIQIENLIFEQPQRTKQDFERGFGFDFGFSPPPRGRFGFLPPFPPLPGIAPRGSRRVSAKRKLKRSPSLISILGGIERTPFNLEQEMTGLVARGLKAPGTRKKRKDGR